MLRPIMMQVKEMYRDLFILYALFYLVSWRGFSVWNVSSQSDREAHFLKIKKEGGEKAFCHNTYSFYRGCQKPATEICDAALRKKEKRMEQPEWRSKYPALCLFNLIYVILYSSLFQSCDRGRTFWSLMFFFFCGSCAGPHLNFCLFRASNIKFDRASLTFNDLFP